MQTSEPKIQPTSATASLDALLEVAADLPPREPFRRSNPIEASRASLAPRPGIGGDDEGPHEVSGLEPERDLGIPLATSPVVAIDAGVANLGATPDGLIAAYRAAA